MFSPHRAGSPGKRLDPLREPLDVADNGVTALDAAAPVTGCRRVRPRSGASPRCDPALSASRALVGGRRDEQAPPRSQEGADAAQGEPLVDAR